MRVELSVPDLSCDHCRRSVQEALGNQGCQAIQVDLAEKQVVFEAEEARVPAALAAMEEVGYPALRL